MRLLSGLVLAFSLTGCASLTTPTKTAEPASILNTYSEIAEAGYTDSVILAKELRSKIHALLNNPTEATLENARQSWIASRVPYQQTEVFRFGNEIVDDWEGRVNAWPLDEGLIDYVDTSSYGAESDENLFYTANVIANKTLRLGNQKIDARKITAELLAETLHEADENEANVATGYHAIEFLLWGQDLYGTEAGSGERPATDYSLNNCTGGNCDRRGEYLKVATDLLISDLEEMAANWQEGGEARTALAEKGADAGLATILIGMGSLSYGELAGERTKLPLMLHDPEEEHDCFSDNTHNSHFYNTIGMRNVYLGEYTRIDGSKIAGPSISDLVKAKDAKLDKQLRAELNASINAASAIVKSAEKGTPFDMLIGAGNKQGNAIVQGLVDGLTTQTRSIEAAMSLLGLENTGLEGSDSLDNPDSIN